MQYKQKNTIKFIILMLTQNCQVKS